MADNVRMPSKVRVVAAAWAALACAGCPSVGALECPGTTCTDASTADAPSSRDGASSGTDASDASVSTIFCGAASCTPPGAECCFENGATSCIPAGTCNGGSDIFCDDGSQCDGGTCWICINGQGFQGASCDYQGDIVGNWKCNQTNAMVLCRSSSECADGGTCTPLEVSGLDAGDGQSFFSTCQ
jgi:hypothetical protein